MLTVWDTDAVVCVASVSSMTQTKTSCTKGSDINFVMADGVKKAPVGVAERFVFRLKSVYFAVRSYVVVSANYQLLLGTECLVATGTGIFLRWGKMVATLPSRIEIDAHCRRITADVGPPPLVPEEGDEYEEEKFELLLPHTAMPVSTNYMPKAELPALFMAPEAAAIRIGMRDLGGEVQGTLPIADIDISMSQIQNALRAGLPLLTPEFVLQNLSFGPNVTAEVKVEIASDVIRFADVFSWNQFDLGCIKDVPHTISRFDFSHAIMEFCCHLANPIN